MSDRARELADRRATLQLRCAAQRRAVARDVQGIEARLHSVDRAAEIARDVLLHPMVIVASVVVLLAVGRTRMFHLLGRGLVLATAARRLLRLARNI
jgi:hypothetical protein